MTKTSWIHCKFKLPKLSMNHPQLHVRSQGLPLHLAVIVPSQTMTWKHIGPARSVNRILLETFLEAELQN
jgi:hypothetical protein